MNILQKTFALHPYRCAIGAMLGLLITFSAQARDVISLDRGWKFTDASGKCSIVNLPHDFLIGQPWIEPDADDHGDANNEAANIKSRLSPRAFKEMGTGTYVRSLSIPQSMSGQQLLLDFGGIMLVGDVYLNGERIGGTDYGYLGFEIDITDKVRFDADNELKVVASTGEASNSRWYTGGGLYRSVKLIARNKDMHFARHPLAIVTDSISAHSAKINISADIEMTNRDEQIYVHTTIQSPDGNTAASRRDTLSIIAKWPNREYPLPYFSIHSPQLWSVDEPNLYTCIVTIEDADGNALDTASSTFGIRTIEYSPDFGLKLNGQKVLLKGIANHHTLGALGAANYPRAIEKRLQLLKEFGFNHIRCSHNPYSEEFMALCDKYGMLVVDELYDKWLTEYAGGRTPWQDMWQHDVPEWVKRDRNHPSVVMWSLGNELQGFNNLPHNDWGVTTYKLLSTLLRRYDDTRPVTVAMHPRVRSLETDSVPAPLVFETDIAAYNYRYMYFPGDSRRWPHMIFYQSEANLSNMGPNFFTPDNERVVGLAYWGMIDYLGESLGWPAKGWTNGVFDISLEPKSMAWFLRSYFRPEQPLVHIGVVTPKERIDWNGVDMGGELVLDRWDFEKGDSLKIYTYTNASEVALLINGREHGRQKNDIGNPDRRNRIIWEGVPYYAGEIVAVGYDDNGKETCRHQLSTPGKAVRLVLEADNDKWQADGYDLQHIRVKAVDSKGRTVYNDRRDVEFALTGSASIVAVDNGDMYSAELHTPDSPTAARRALHQGTALAILRADTIAEPCILTAKATGLKAASIKLNLDSRQ